MDLVFHVLALAVSLTVVGPGALAHADPGVLERVQDLRVRYGWGLGEPTPDNATLVAVDDCGLVGASGVALVEGIGQVPIAVVDCSNGDHQTLESLGLVADVNERRLGHRKAILILWR